MPDFLQFAFDAASSDTIAKGAVLELKIIPIKIECLQCHHTCTVDKNTYVCPACQTHKLKIISGKEILIESIEGDKHAN
jgi:hydrogenase nickel incorporation protein HypA/HybF